MRVEAFAAHVVMFALDVSAHHIGVEFGMELHADGSVAITKQMMRITCRAGEHSCIFRDFQNTLLVRRMCAEFGRQMCGKRILLGASQQFDRQRPDLTATR